MTEVKIVEKCQISSFVKPGQILQHAALQCPASAVISEPNLSGRAL